MNQVEEILLKASILAQSMTREEALKGLAEIYGS